MAKSAETEPAKKVRVLLFKPSGKYYDSFEWSIPTDYEVLIRGGKVSETALHGPQCMKYSEDFIDKNWHGSILVEKQEPWGYPVIFPPKPHRADLFAEWLKNHRDKFNTPHLVEWRTIDDLLDDYRLHADMGVYIQEHACSGPDCEC